MVLRQSYEIYEKTEGRYFLSATKKEKYAQFNFRYFRKIYSKKLPLLFPLSSNMD